MSKNPQQSDLVGSDVSRETPSAHQKFRWANLSYTTRVTIAFAFIAAMTALVAIGVLSFVWGQHFQTYTRENMENIATATADRIAAKYEKAGTWNTDVISPAVHVTAAYSGVGIMVIDAEGNTKYDSTNATGQVPEEFSGSLAPSSTSQMAVASIVADTQTGEEQTIGSVQVWVYGSDTLLRQTDQHFRDNSYQAMLFASVLAIVLASCIGFLFARNLVRPINRMTSTAKAIKEGDLSARTHLEGEDEIARLGMTFDEMAESVEKDRELERRLTTDVAHELRTPLMAIQSTVEAMVDGVFAPDEIRLETLNSEVRRLSRLVDALLKLSRLENRSKPLNLAVVDVGELVAGIIATHEAFVADSGLSLVCKLDPDVMVYGDADMIRQATANLISNAVRYTPEGGIISVQVKRGDIMAAIMVEDTGIGLSPEEIKMVFSRFWRADAGRNRESGGLGIGLSIVKEIVDRHGGWVQVEGEKGVGARFTIHLPLYDGQAYRAKDRQARGARRQKTHERN